MCVCARARASAIFTFERKRKYLYIRRYFSLSFHVIFHWCKSFLISIVQVHQNKLKRGKPLMSAVSDDFPTRFLSLFPPETTPTMLSSTPGGIYPPHEHRGQDHKRIGLIANGRKHKNNFHFWQLVFIYLLIYLFIIKNWNLIFLLPVLAGSEPQVYLSMTWNWFTKSIS